MCRVYWSYWYLKNAKGIIASTDHGIAYVGSPYETGTDFQDWATKVFNHSTLINNEDKLRNYKLQLEDFFTGRRKEFTVNFDLRGSLFQQQVWEILKCIPFGETVSYSDVARRLGKPNSYRAVASAIATNPILIMIPCHRVVRKNGKNTGYRGGLTFKYELLQLEKDILNNNPS